jgi:adenylate cyclase
VRVRDEADAYVITVKGGSGASRTELEVPIDADTFRWLWRLTRVKRIEKVRHHVPIDSLTVELDVYRGKLRGLRTAEVEFDSDRAMLRFRPPEWLGREITGWPEFANSSLATRDKPPPAPRQNRR